MLALFGPFHCHQLLKVHVYYGYIGKSGDAIEVPAQLLASLKNCIMPTLDARFMHPLIVGVQALKE